MIPRWLRTGVVRRAARRLAQMPPGLARYVSLARRPRRARGDVLTGRARPEGKLPFELPASVEAVGAQRADRPHDRPRPLYPVGYGLRW